jgi:uncharacterized surface protein with fasciclin (FAS1) repeats
MTRPKANGHNAIKRYVHGCTRPARAPHTSADHPGPGSRHARCNCRTPGSCAAEAARCSVGGRCGTAAAGRGRSRIPTLSALSAALSGKLNPAVNLVDTLNGGQVTVFAPGTTHFPTASEAIASLQTDAARLTHLLTYHVIPGGSVLDYIKNNTPFESDIPGTIVQHRVHDAQGVAEAVPAT